MNHETHGKLTLEKVNLGATNTSRKPGPPRGPIIFFTWAPLGVLPAPEESSMGWGPPWWQAHAPGTARAPAGREKKGGGGGGQWSSRGAPRRRRQQWREHVRLVIYFLYSATAPAPARAVKIHQSAWREPFSTRCPSRRPAQERPRESMMMITLGRQ